MTDSAYETRINELVNAYNLVIGGVEDDANSSDRAYGGVIRAAKGTLVEALVKNMVGIAWEHLGGDPARLSLEKHAFRIPIKADYIQRLAPAEVRQYIEEHKDEYFYQAKTDVHVSIDGNFIMGIECKAYTENAMMKRILVDFTLLKSANPELICILFQLESQLGGDYSEVMKGITYGSPSTHTLMSYFDVDLHIITVVEGERKVDRPIHKLEYRKDLPIESLKKALKVLEEHLSLFI